MLRKNKNHIYSHGSPIYEDVEPVKIPFMKKVIRYIFLTVLVYCILIVLCITDEYQTEEKKTEEYQNEYLIYEETEEKNEFSVDFEKLKKKNSDSVAWLRFDQPEVISYPVVQAKDNSFYLRRDINKKYSAYGTLFMDSHNKNDFTDSNTIIYGHNMLNGSMFGSLKKYKTKEYWEKNSYFYIYTPDNMVHKYHIYGVYIVGPYSDIFTYSFGNTNLLQEYLDMTSTMKLYKTGIHASISDHTVTLSTCTSNSTKRLVLQGYEIEKHELN